VTGYILIWFTRTQTVTHLSTNPAGWRHSVVVSALALINVVNRHWAWLVLGWVTVRSCVMGYVPLTASYTVPLLLPLLHSRELNSQPINHKSDALITAKPHDMTACRMLFVRLKEMERGGQSGFQESMQDVNIGGEISRQREELESLRRQTNSESEALRRLRTEYDSMQREMEMLLEAIDKRHQLLDSLDSELDSDITAQRRDIEVQSVVSYLLFFICLYISLCADCWNLPYT